MEYLSGGGIEAVVLSYFNNIDHTKYHIDFLLHGHKENCKDNDAHNYLISNGSTIYYVTPRGENPIKNKFEIARILKENKYDIVHSHMDAAGYFFLKQAKKVGVPLCISHSHNTASDKLHNPFKRIIYKIIHKMCIKKLSNVTDVRIACSMKAGNWLFKGTNFIVLNNAIDINKYSYNEQLREKIRKELNIKNEIVIGHVGRFTLQKNHELLIEIFENLLKIIPEAKLILIGIGELLDTIKHKVNILGIEKNVIFLGSCNNVNELMNAFDVFLLPSLYEGLPVAGIEAQASGLPCIISSTVSTEIKLSENVKLLSLDTPISEWVDTIVKFSKSNINIYIKNPTSYVNRIFEMSGIYQIIPKVG